MSQVSVNDTWVGGKAVCMSGDQVGSYCSSLGGDEEDFNQGSRIISEN